MNQLKLFTTSIKRPLPRIDYIERARPRPVAAVDGTLQHV